MRDALSGDKVLSMLADQISEGFTPDKKLLRIDLREYFQHWEKWVPLY